MDRHSINRIVSVIFFISTVAHEIEHTSKQANSRSLLSIRLISFYKILFQQDIIYFWNDHISRSVIISHFNNRDFQSILTHRWFVPSYFWISTVILVSEIKLYSRLRYLYKTLCQRHNIEDTLKSFRPDQVGFITRENYVSLFCVLLRIVLEQNICNIISCYRSKNHTATKIADRYSYE